MENFGGEFWAAIAGAIVGGLIALVIQLVALWAAKAERKEDHNERRRALGYALLFKMIQIYSNLRQLRDHLAGAYERGLEDGLEEPWQFVMPIVNVPDRVEFSTDEMSMLLSLGNDDVFNDLASLDQVHNSLCSVFQTYKLRRMMLTDLLPSGEMAGVRGFTNLTEAQVAILRPKMAELNDLVQSLSIACPRDTATAEDVLQRLADLLREKVGITQRIQLV